MRGLGLVAALASGLLLASLSCQTANVGGIAPDGGTSGGASSTSGGTGNEGGEDNGAGGGDSGRGNGGSAGAQGGNSNGGSAGTPPDCDGGVCLEGCGDGIVNQEECDDGNRLDSDGCSSACTIEQGFTCSVATCRLVDGVCALELPATLRDFNAAASAGGHPDFQPGINQITAITGLVEADLDVEGKPVASALALGGSGFIHSADGFAQWYRDTPGVNVAIAGNITLWDNGGGGYVNRWGALGEPWQTPVTYTNFVIGSLTVGMGCPDCTPTPGLGQCFDPCTPAPYTSDSYSCCLDVSQPAFDGNPLFFPIDPPAAGLLTDTRYTAKIPDTYGTIGYPTEAMVATSLGIVTPIATATAPFPSLEHNFHFTTELKVLARYDANASVSLAFAGDDDVWVFVNGKLAVDLGGWHPPLEGSVTVDSTTAANFGLVNGAPYEIAIFHAERQTDGSSFRLSLSGLDLRRTVCAQAP